MSERTFDVIFSTDTLRTSPDLEDIVAAQERGSAAYVREVTARVADLRERLSETVGPELVVGFGLNTTSTIALLLPLLPRGLVSGVKEFPPVVGAVDALGAHWLGLLDCEHGRYLAVDPHPSTDADEYLLLLSHVAYIDGEDLLDEGLAAALDAAPELRGRPAHLLVDGAHAIGNHFTVSQIPALRRRLESLLPVASFTYVFDFHKWIQGVMGMAVVVTSDPRLRRVLDWVFPNSLSFDNAIVRFEAPLSVSFNPALVYWLLNLRLFSERLFDDGLPERNRALTDSFLAAFDPTPWVGLAPCRATNLLALETPSAVELHAHLGDAGFRTHLIGGRHVRAGGVAMRFEPCVRLAFRDGLVDVDDVAALTAALAAWRSDGVPAPGDGSFESLASTPSR